MERGRLQRAVRRDVQSPALGGGRAVRMASDGVLQEVRFTKAHAFGNDFLYVLQTDAAGTALDDLARTLCARQTGVGADGLILYEPSPGGASMKVFNADGSRSEVSGDGVGMSG